MPIKDKEKTSDSQGDRPTGSEVEITSSTGESNESAERRAREGRTSPPQLHTIREGDTWQGLALMYYGDPDRWMEIYQANRLFYESPLAPLVPGAQVSVPIGLTETRLQPEGENSLLGTGGLTESEEQHEGLFERSLALRFPTPLAPAPQQLDLGGHADSKPLMQLSFLDQEWESAVNRALLDGLGGLANEIRDNRDLEIGDVLPTIGKDMASSLGQYALGKLEDRYFPDGYTFDTVWDFAKEYPVLAILGGVAAGYAGYDLVKRKGTISISTGIVSGKVNLETMDWEVMLRYKITF